VVGYATALPREATCVPTVHARWNPQTRALILVHLDCFARHIEEQTDRVDRNPFRNLIRYPFRVLPSALEARRRLRPGYVWRKLNFNYHPERKLPGCAASPSQLWWYESGQAFSRAVRQLQAN
jgi:hypothetical protein